MFGLEEIIAQHSEKFWFVLAIIFFGVEVFVGGIGLLFAGLAAVTLGAVILLGGLELSVGTQIGYFFVLTAVWAAALWKPFRKWAGHDKGAAYSDFVGSTAVVTGGSLIKGKEGKVKWSGAEMRARLSKESLRDEVKEGEDVWVHKKRNGILIVCTEEIKTEESK